MPYPALEYVSVPSLRRYDRNARTHSKKQIKQIANSIERFGFTNPVLISDDGQIIAGHGRVEAAKVLKIERVPTLRLSHLSDAERRAYILADNKLAQNAGWDREILAIELQGLIDLNFDVDLTGFGLAEIDMILDDARDGSPDTSPGPEDELPAVGDPAFSVTRPGDIWLVGRHRLVCGDARFAEPLRVLLDGEEADLIFTDPSYNVPIDGHVCGLGRIRHREFAMGVGEMSPDAFTDFLRQTLATPRRIREMARSLSYAWAGGIWANFSPPDKRSFRAKKHLRLEQVQRRNGDEAVKEARETPVSLAHERDEA